MYVLRWLLVVLRCILRGIRLHKCPYWVRPGITISDHNGIQSNLCHLLASCIGDPLMDSY